MDYKEKYEQALEKAKDMIERLEKGENILLKEDLKLMFPELIETSIIDEEKAMEELIELKMNFLK